MYDKKWWLILLVVWLISGIYVGARLNRGWVPHDEGALAQAAERVAQGELPHRDFDEIYTGGLSYLDAGAFRLFGTNLLSLRLVLLAFFLAWVPAYYYVASRLSNPIAAGATTLAAVAWSVPNYSAALPSWYNLFFAGFGTAAFFRHMERGRRRWLAIAGICGGMSFLAKISGLYFVIGGLLFLMYREHCAAMRNATESEQKRRSYGLFLAIFLSLFVCCLILVVRKGHGTDLVYYVVPAASIVVFLVWNESMKPAGRLRARLRHLAQVVAPFATGAAFPVALFFIPYVLTGSVSKFLFGVFIAPTKRLSSAYYAPPDVRYMVASIPAIAFLAHERLYGITWKWHRKTLAVVLLLALLALTPRSPQIYALIWHSASTLIPLVTIAGIVLLSLARLPIDRRQQLMLVLCITALCSLVQFPFSAPIYFCYIAPLVALCVLAMTDAKNGDTGWMRIAAISFYLAFAVFFTNRGFIDNLGDLYVPDVQSSELDMDRGRILVSSKDRREYADLMSAIKNHSAGEFIYATPDCPEVYFLAKKRNPTRTMFEFLEDPQDPPECTLATISAHRIKLVVINRDPRFSARISRELSAKLKERFPHAAFGERFEVRWRP